MNKINFRKVSSKTTPVNASNLNQIQGDVKMGTGMRYEKRIQKDEGIKGELKKIGKILTKFIFHVLYDSLLIWLGLNFVFIVFKWGIRANFLQILAPYLLYIILYTTFSSKGEY